MLMSSGLALLAMVTDPVIAKPDIHIVLRFFYKSSLQLILLEAFRESVVERTMENRTKNLGFKVSAKIEALPMVPIHQANTEVTGNQILSGAADPI